MAQTGIGYGSGVAPRTTLDVNGATAVAETTVDVSSNAGTIPSTSGQVQLTGSPTAVVLLSAGSSPAPVTGQQLAIYNATTFAATFGSTSIPAGQATSFLYSNGGWQASAASAGSPAWDLLGNAGTVDGTNFIGTTDNVALSFRVFNQSAGRIGFADGNVFYGYQSGLSIASGV